MHTLATHHRGAGHPIDRDIDLPIEDTEVTDTDKDNESVSRLETTVALGGLMVEGNPNELIPSNHAKLTALTRKRNELC